MAYYAYKTVRDLLPDHIIKAQGDAYEGNPNYDGDMWYATEDYINELLDHRKTLAQALKQMLDAFHHDPLGCGQDAAVEAALDAVAKAQGEK